MFQYQLPSAITRGDSLKRLAFGASTIVIPQLLQAKGSLKGTGIKALEYFNGHMMDKAGNKKFFKELRKRCDNLGATNTMMLCKSNCALDSSKAKTHAQSVD